MINKAIIVVEKLLAQMHVFLFNLNKRLLSYLNF